jgi:hypothetical protein
LFLITPLCNDLSALGGESRLQVHCSQLCCGSISIANCMHPAAGVAQSGKRHRSREVKQRSIERALAIRCNDREGRIGVRQAHSRIAGDVGNERFVSSRSKLQPT